MSIFKIGDWHYDLVSGDLYWGTTTRAIHEVTVDYVPNLADAINFYSEEEPGREAIRKAVHEAQNNSVPWDLECNFVTAKGQQLWVRSTGNVSKDELGNTIGLQGYFQDITSYKRLLESSHAYKRDLEYQQYALDKHSIVSISDPAGKILYANEKLVGISGYTHDELIGQNHRILSSGYHDNAFWDQFWQQISSGEVYRTEMCNRSKADKLYWVDSTVVPHFDEHGTIDRYISIRADITERKRQEENSRRLEESVRHLQKMETIGQLVGGVAHDFNNLLAVILGYAMLLETQLANNGNSNSDMTRYIGQVVQSGKRAKDLVSKLLAFSRGSNESPEVISINTSIREFISISSSVIPSSIDFDYSLPKDDLKINYNATSLSQVIMNLCINARDAMPLGGRLSINAYHLETVNEVCTSCRQKFNSAGSGYVCISVTDTGTGIEPEILSRIFEPFFSSKEIKKGAGMGLSMVHGLVHGGDGHVVVDSRPGDGCQFRVLLPAVGNTNAIPAYEAKPLRKIDLVGKKIAVIDDDADILMLISDFMADTQALVSLFQSPASFVAKLNLNSTRYDAIITDVTMPDFSGVDIANLVKRKGADTTLIAMSGYSDLISDTSYREAGFYGYLDKPLSKDDLLEMLEAAVESRQT